MKSKKNLNIYFVVVLVLYPLINTIYITPAMQNISRIMLMCTIFLLAISIKYKKGIHKEDFILLFSAVYMFSSLLLFMMVGNITISAVLREMLYSILPIFIYFIFLNLTNEECEICIRRYIQIIFFVSLIGLLVYLNVEIPVLGVVTKKIEQANPFKWQLASIYGPIVMGYLTQLAFALIIFEKYEGKFKKGLILWFGIIILLVLQRSAYIGIAIALSIYIYGLVKEGKLKSAILSINKILVMGILLLILIIILDKTKILPWDLGSLLTGKINQIRLGNVVSDRVNQFVLFNDTNFLNILFGEGFGKYSPNNPNAFIKQPDASYYRIYNELGLIGLIVVFFPFVVKLLRAIKKNNFFIIYLISHVLIAFYFNRVLWAIPSNFIIFMIIAIYQDSVKSTNK